MASDDRASGGTMSAHSARIRMEDPAQRRERRIAEFQANVRPRIAALTLGAPALEDLAESFPALLFAMAVGYNAGALRDRALQMTCEGVGLRHIAEAYELPAWLRRLPAGAFSEMMPRLPCDADYALRLGSFIPAERRRAQAWFQAVTDAYLAGGREFSLWTARNWSVLMGSMLPQRVTLVSAWHWYSSQPGTRGHALLQTGWDTRRSTSAMTDDINVWIKRIALVEWLGNGALQPWIPDAQVGLYEFQALRTADDYISAAAELDNCLEQFAGRLANGVSMVARILRSGKIVACIEVGLHDIDPTMPAIVQLRGHKNKRVPPELWRKAYDWLSHAPLEPFVPERLTPPAADRMAARLELWGPYIAAIDAHADPAGKVAALRLKRLLLPRIKPDTAQGRERIIPISAIRGGDERQPTMLQRVREHIATLTGFQHTEHELMRWDAVERLEVALRGRGGRR
jgi:hypothetical protein